MRVPEVYFVFSPQENRYRYIAMQHVACDTVKPSEGHYANGDVPAVTAAVKQLTSIRAPERLALALGAPAAPVANKLVVPQGLRVDFSCGTAESLQWLFVPAMSTLSNFIKETVFAVDFNFWPRRLHAAIIRFVFDRRPFTRTVARLVQYPKSANLVAIQLAGSAGGFWQR